MESNNLFEDELDKLEKKLKNSWCKETCYSKMQSEWTKNNKSLGQCAVTSLIINDYFGGEIYKVIINDISHYINIINKKIVDLTKEQFGNIEVEYKDLILKTREEISRDKNTLERYFILKEKVDRN